MTLVENHPYIFTAIEYGWVIIGALAGWFYKPLINRITTLEKEIQAHKEYLPITYVTKADLKEIITEMKQSNRESMAEIKSTMNELKHTFERYTDKVIELLSHTE